MDIIFGIGAWRLPREGGIEINCLRYDSVDMAKYRSIYGEKEKVYIKYHPSDLGFIDVFNSHKNEFFRVAAIDNSYANKLTLYQHKMIKEYVKEEMKRSDEDVRLLMDGKIQLREMVNECLENNPKALRGKRGAKIREGELISKPLKPSSISNSEKNNSKNDSHNVIEGSEHDMTEKKNEDDSWDGSNIEWD